jgi:CRISPR-associated protein Cmr4
MTDAIFTSIYTLTPTHCGTGQTSGAVDLPIARETHTGFPVLPASSLKGAARHAFRGRMSDPDEEEWLFGSDVDNKEGTKSEIKPGALVILEGRLLLYPLRSLARPFVYATCPLILERLHRDLRALGFTPDWEVPALQQRLEVMDPSLAGNALVIEDLAYRPEEVVALLNGDRLTEFFASLLPPEESSTRNRLKQSLVVTPSDDFADVIRRVAPVQARIRLTKEKTTTGEDGNLWYEETLPSDCLFGVFLSNRRRLSDGRDPCDVFLRYLNKERSMQLGGNETVGQGYCWWTAQQRSENASQGGQSHAD